MPQHAARLTICPMSACHGPAAARALARAYACKVHTTATTKDARRSIDRGDLDKTQSGKHRPKRFDRCHKLKSS
jgi:hypothetical protein